MRRTSTLIALAMLAAAGSAAVQSTPHQPAPTPKRRTKAEKKADKRARRVFLMNGKNS